MNTTNSLSQRPGETLEQYAARLWPDPRVRARKVRECDRRIRDRDLRREISSGVSLRDNVLKK